MSHHHTRPEKNCLNCGAEVSVRFCSVCGQENVEPRENAWHLVRHFFEDITHFDGKFFTSYKTIMLKPGKLAEEYMHGKRASFLNPIRMYLLTSAIFVLLFTAIESNHGHTDPAVADFRVMEEMHNYRTQENLGLYTTSVPNTTERAKGFYFPAKYAFNGVHVYDSIQHALPPAKRDNFLTRYASRTWAAAATLYHKDPNEFMEKLGERLLHSFSEVFFLSLPFFALMLQILYFRRKQYYFVAHTVFAIHFYCVSFMSFLICTLLQKLTIQSSNETIMMAYLILLLLTILGTFAYLYTAMLRFYKQGWFKTSIKFLVQSLTFIIALIVLTIAVFFQTFVNMVS